MRRLVLAVGLTVLVATFPAGGLGGKGTSSTALYPDLQTVVPRHLVIQNQQQREYLRFANGIANTGAGGLQLRPDPPPRTVDTLITTAVQELLDASGNVVASQEAGTFEVSPGAQSLAHRRRRAVRRPRRVADRAAPP